MSDEQNERAKQAGEKVDRAADWFELRQLAERIFVAAASNLGSPPYYTRASASFLAAEHFILEANKRAPK